MPSIGIGIGISLGGGRAGTPFVPTEAPANVAPPAITGPNTPPIVGDTLTAYRGAWTQHPTSYTYQWVNSESGDISGATGQTYVVTEDDIGATLYVEVTATNGIGSSSPEASDETGVVTDVHHTATSLVFSTQPDGATVDTQFAQQPVVTVKDENDDTLTSFSGNVTIAVASGTGTLSGTLVKAAVAGVATFTNLQLDTEGDFTLEASIASPSLSVESASFNVAEASADPIAGYDWARRWQSHNGDYVPLGLYKDTDATIPATAPSDLIAAWRDEMSGSLGLVTQGTSGSRPALGFYGVVPTLDFVGKELTDPSFAELDNITEFTAILVASYSAVGCPVYADGAVLGFQLFSGSIYCYVTSDGVGGNSGHFAFDKTAPVVITLKYDGSLSGNENRLKVYLNGVQQTLTISGTIPSSTGTAAGLIFGSFAGAAQFVGSMSVFLLTLSALADGPRSISETYARSIGNVFTMDTGTLGGQAYEVLIPQTPNGRGVVYFHGAGEDQTAARTSGRNAPAIKSLVDAGYTVFQSNGHNPAWGNTATEADYAAGAALLVSDYAVTDGVVLMAGSMGNLAALNAIRNGSIDDIMGYVGCQPVCNLANMYETSFMGQINTAYDIPGGGDYATQTAGRDPVLFDPTPFTGLKMRFYASPDDTVVTKVDNADEMAALVQGFAAENTVVSTTGEHGDPSGFPPAAILAFINSCF